MNAKSLAKNVGVVVVGIMIAGYAMYMLRDVEIVDDARKGYGG